MTHAHPQMRKNVYSSLLLILCIRTWPFTPESAITRNSPRPNPTMGTREESPQVTRRSPISHYTISAEKLLILSDIFQDTCTRPLPLKQITSSSWTMPNNWTLWYGKTRPRGVSLALWKATRISEGSSKEDQVERDRSSSFVQSVHLLRLSVPCLDS